MKKTFHLLVIFMVFLLTHTLFASGIPSDSSRSAQSDSMFTHTSQIPDVSGSFYKVFLITGILLLIFVAIMFVYKKLSGRPVISTKSRIFIISRQNLGPKQSVMVVSIENKKYALGVTDHSVQLITELGPVAENEVNDTPLKISSQNFGALLNKIRAKQ